MASANSGPRARKACCLVSEILEEAGLDREKALTLRKQILEGLILLCRWQLERMDSQAPAPPQGGAKRGARKVPLS